MTILKSFSVCLLTLFLLSGCENMKGPFSGMHWPDWNAKNANQTAAADCPGVNPMPDLDSVTDIRGTDIVTETSFGQVSSTCTTKEANATVRLNIGFNSRLGPAGVKDASVEATYSIPYLVAVINPKGEIISKDIFAISLVYKKGQTSMNYTDVLEQVIPLDAGTRAEQYKIMVGFQLSDAQLAFNRTRSAQKTVK